MPHLIKSFPRRTPTILTPFHIHKGFIGQKFLPLPLLISFPKLCQSDPLTCVTSPEVKIRYLDRGSSNKFLFAHNKSHPEKHNPDLCLDTWAEDVDGGDKGQECIWKALLAPLLVGPLSIPPFPVGNRQSWWEVSSEAMFRFLYSWAAIH